MKLKKWLYLGLSLVLILGVLSSCKDDTPGKTEPPESTEATTAPPTETTTEYQDPYPLQSEEPPQSFPVPEEGRLANQEGEVMVAVSSVYDGYYFGRQVLMFYDGTTKETRVLCQKPACTHQDSSCTAWLGEITSMIEYQGVLYFTRTEEAGAQLCTKNPETGEIQVLTQWAPPQEGKIACAIQKASYNQFLLRFDQSQLVVRDGLSHREEKAWTALYDLETRTQRELVWDQAEDFIGIYLLNREYAVAGAWKAGEAPGKAYYEVRLYSLADGSYSLISSQEKNGYRRSVDACFTYGDLMVLLEKDTLYVYDLSTLEKREIITMTDIQNYWIADGKVFFSVKNAPEGMSAPLLRLYYVGLEGGTPTRLNNNGAGKSVYFRFFWEGSSFFVGVVLDESLQPRQYLISKADYYTDNFAMLSDFSVE